MSLTHGAVQVYAVDVGYGQLDWKLRNDPRVLVLEKRNIRYLNVFDLSDLGDERRLGGNHEGVERMELKIGSLRSLIANWDSLQKARRTERDKLFQRVATLKAKTKEFEVAVADARSAQRVSSRRNDWSTTSAKRGVESLRLQVLEAQIVGNLTLAEVARS